VPLELPRARVAAWIESVADAAAAASVTPDTAAAVHMSSRERPMQLQLPRARATALIESVADAAAAASVAPDRAISGADTEQRASCAAQASESGRNSVDGERCRRSCGGERHTRLGDQRCRHRAVTEQRAACAAQASENESSSVDRERCRRSCAGERHIRPGDQRCRHRAASGLCRSSFREREQQR